MAGISAAEVVAHTMANDLVQVFTVTEGLAPEEVEKYVTYPVEVSMTGLPGVEKVRSVSNFGLSVVNVYFEDKTDIYWARQLVAQLCEKNVVPVPPSLVDRLRERDDWHAAPFLATYFLRCNVQRRLSTTWKTSPSRIAPRSSSTARA